MNLFNFTRYAGLLIFVVFILISCSDTDSSPEEVAMQWKIYMDKGDYTAAKTISTPSAIEFIEFIERLEAEMGKLDETDTADLPVGTNEEVNCTVSGNTASCIICCDDMGNPEEFDLILTGGQWLVDLEFDPAIEQDLKDFETMMKELQDLMEESQEQGDFPAVPEEELPEME